MEWFIHEEKQMTVSEKWVGLRFIMLSEIQKPERQALHIFSDLWSRNLNLCVCAYGDQVTRMGTVGSEGEIVKEGKVGEKRE